MFSDFKPFNLLKREKDNELFQKYLAKFDENFCKSTKKHSFLECKLFKAKKSRNNITIATSLLL